MSNKWPVQHDIIKTMRRSTYFTKTNALLNDSIQSRVADPEKIHMRWIAEFGFQSVLRKTGAVIKIRIRIQMLRNPSNFEGENKRKHPPRSFFTFKVFSEEKNTTLCDQLKIVLSDHRRFGILFFKCAILNVMTGPIRKCLIRIRSNDYGSATLQENVFYDFYLTISYS